MPGRRKEAVELRRPPERAGSDGDQRKAGEGNGRRRHHRSGERQKARRETGSVRTDGRQRSGGGGRVGILGIPEGERGELGVLEWVCAVSAAATDAVTGRAKPPPLAGTVPASPVFAFRFLLSLLALYHHKVLPSPVLLSPLFAFTLPPPPLSRYVTGVAMTYMNTAHNDNSRGSLIVLEGLDRSGKTSQSNRLVTFLKEKGLSVELWRFPDRSTSTGQMISAYLANESQLDDRAIHLLFSANRWEKR
ncbi:hypothetical protein B296_00013830 [Ensete ventricosum]|uniref:Thymidylate kinase-like domain-containing protein n=1 Tax=Ensete ventricosum TaxID=4639 RepID=A0A426ZT71_ENSVE|nr:hypothetical protein B296_00013830 [Ensete ventricosum]